MKINVDLDRIIEAVESDEYLGFCIVCGEEVCEVEPDAEKYKCPHGCGNTVYGAEQLLIYMA